MFLRNCNFLRQIKWTKLTFLKSGLIRASYLKKLLCLETLSVVPSSTSKKYIIGTKRSSKCKTKQVIQLQVVFPNNNNLLAKCAIQGMVTHFKRQVFVVNQTIKLNLKLLLIHHQMIWDSHLLQQHMNPDKWIARINQSCL